MPLPLQVCGWFTSPWHAWRPPARYEFALWNLAPVERNGWAFLGEAATKWVGVSAERVRSLAVNAAGGLHVVVRGAPHERVTLLFAPPDASRAVSVICHLPPSGRAVAVVRGGIPKQTCVGHGQSHEQ